VELENRLDFGVLVERNQRRQKRIYKEEDDVTKRGGDESWARTEKGARRRGEGERDGKQ
jgi:hypothetical protein